MSRPESQCEVGLIPLVVAIDELGALVASAVNKKEKAQLSLCLIKQPLKGRPRGVILVVASQFASVDTIPNAEVTIDKNSGSAPAELVRTISQRPASGARSAQVVCAFVYVMDSQDVSLTVPGLARKISRCTPKWGGFVNLITTRKG